MISSRSPFAGLLFLALLGGASAFARHDDNEQALLARIQRETNPVKKAKYEIRLGRVKLRQAISAFEQGQFEQFRSLLGAYLDRIKSSWETLRNSGRRPARQPQGFKDLDIALREDTRLLEDLKRRVPYMDRAPVEKTAEEVEQIRSEVLRALFPSEHTGGDTKTPSPHGSHFSVTSNSTL